jgi:two-component system CheB/CheR fusion protein
MFDFPTLAHEAEIAARPAANSKALEETMNIRQIVEQTLLAEYAPASALVNANGELLYIHGRTGKYLEPAVGQATLSIVKMAREGLKVELANALRTVAVHKEIIRHKGLLVKTNGGSTLVNLTVAPVTKPAASEGLILVTFEDAPAAVHPDLLLIPTSSDEKVRRIAEMEQQLKLKDELLQTTVEELESANEELRSTNEELQSINEELQSTIEELETSKEELQSLNEELMTTNLEQMQRVEEMAHLNNDMNNLLTGTGIATIFVDQQLRIKRFTPMSTQVINLIPTDIGRPMSHFASNLDHDNLVRDIEAVLATLTPKESEVHTKDGNWYLMRILPYRTLENVIDGAIITFVQITEQKQVQSTLRQLTQQVHEASEYTHNIVESLREPLLVLDAKLSIQFANRAFYETFQVQPAETIGRLIYDLGNQQWNIPRLRTLLEEILPAQTVLNDFEVVHDFAGIGQRTMRLTARAIRQAEGKEQLILLVIADITKYKLD